MLDWNPLRGRETPFKLNFGQNESVLQFLVWIYGFITGELGAAGLQRLTKNLNADRRPFERGH